VRLSIYSKILVILLLVSISFADNTVGLIQYDDIQSYTGYTLFAPNTTTTTYLIDINGNLVNQWESEYVAGLSAYLIEDGALLRSAKVEDPAGVQTTAGGFQKFDWDGILIWQYYYGTQHHDIEPLSNGNVLLVTNDRKTKNEAIDAGRDPNFIDGNNIRSLSIIEVEQTGLETGNIVWQWNAWDHLIQDVDNTKPNFGVVADNPELININYGKDGGQDWLHTNSVAYNDDLNQIVVSNRSTNEIWVIDHSTTTEQAATHEGGNSGKGGDLLYRWGNPIAYSAGTADDQKLYGQHDAHWITSGLRGEGNILIFNNGIDRPDGVYSTAVELAPPVDISGNYPLTAGSAFDPTDPVWNYSAPTPEDFSSPRYGGSQRLANGNTLICNSDSGEFFELNQNDEIVWRYISPVTSDGILTQGATEIDNNQVFRCYRYGEDDTAFTGKDLTPGNPIELPANVSVDDEKGNIKDFVLHDNYPNPFNPSTNIEFTLSEASNISLVIYDLVGNEVRTLVNDYMGTGLKSISWDSKDNYGDLVSSGMYLYTLTVDQQSQTKKMMFLR